MSFISFLKSVEQKIAEAIGVVAKIAPVAAVAADAAAIASGNAEVLPFIQKMVTVCTGAGAMVTAVKGTAGTGADKLAAAAPMLDSLVKDSGFLSDKVIADEQKWSKAIVTIAGSFADLFAATTPKPAESTATSATLTAAEPADVAAPSGD